MADTCYQYVIVCSERAKKEWPNALRELEAKYSSRWPGLIQTVLYPHPGALNSCLPRLTELRPSYTCFFVYYKECSRDFVMNVHQLCRRIDTSNPFADTVWGIMTGLEEEDLLFAIKQEPLSIRRVLGGTPVKLSHFESGSWYSEGEACASVHKSRDDEKEHKEKCPQDTTEILINELSKERDVAKETGVDMMITSGHATESDWQIGYSYRNGQFICMSSHMTGKAMDGSLYPVTHNRSPKVLSACGNCLMGHIKSSNCMALAWMHSVGVVQMTGYLDGTWFGFMGWGVHNYFIDVPGMYTFAESFFANNQALVAKLNLKYPQFADKNYADITGEPIENDCLGLVYDRDMVAFYGDPAYEARLVSKPHLHPFQVKVNPVTSDHQMEGWTVNEMLIEVDKVPGRPLVQLLPRSVRKYQILEGNGEGGVVMNCRFILVPFTAESKGKTIRVVYGYM